MIILETSVEADIQRFGHELFNSNRNNLRSFEEAAQIAAEAIFSTFQERDGSPTFALVRIYRMCKTNELAPELRELASDASEQDKWLALMGTTGLEPDWCSRHLSKKHKFIRIDGNLTPMFQAAFQALEITQEVHSNNVHLQFTTPDNINKYLHIPDAQGSHLIPDQDNFVHPYKIQSELGIGSPFLSGSFYIAILFTLVPFNDDMVSRFLSLVPYLSTLFAAYDTRKLWTNQ